MSIGIFDLNISKARLPGFALVCCVSLSACIDSNGAGFSFAPKSTQEPAKTTAFPKTQSATLARGSVNLVAPKGYCIDQSSITNGIQGSSAMLAKCSSLDGRGAGADTTVMTVNVSARRGTEAGSPSVDDLANAVAPAKILQQSQKGTLALVQVATGGNQVFKPADPVHWRGATSLDTRLVMLTLYAPAGSTMTSSSGANLLASLAKGISATRGTLLGLQSPNANATQPKAALKNPAPDTVEPAKKGANGFIARLLNRS